MRLVVLLVFGMLVLITGCQGPPPTVIVVVYTPTPEATATSEQIVSTTAAQSAETPSPLPTAAAAVPTPTVDLFPTATFGQIQVAEQVFERGRMFWIQPRKQIWVLIDDGSGSGTWQVYDDSFTEGEPESDPNIVPPEGKYQPLRGFGKLWRGNADLQSKLGFGLTPEFGYVSNYEYYPGGQIDTEGKWVPGPGYHILFSLYSEKFRFNETDGTWLKVQ
jgi:hypothetical protein